ncbi:MAG: type II secretion system secretin GspD [Halioglobus sp.]|nr:type II secretion system secretin GspD [Halioglobus sp.]
MQRPSSAPDASADAESLDAAAQARPGSDQAAPEPGALAAGGVQSPEDPEGTTPTIFRGTDAVFRRPNPLPPVRLQGEAVSLNFEQAPLTEVVHAVLGDILELDYFVEHPINGQVTLRTRTPVERAQLLDILESLLKANKAHLVRDANGRFLVSASGQMARLKPQITTSAENAVGFSTLIVPLQYISASSMAEILAPVAEETSFVRIDDTRNLLMLAGTRAQLEGWQEMITTFDVDLLKGMSIGIFPIENAPIEDIEAALSAMLGKQSGEPALESLTGIGSVVRIMAIPRLSSVMVVTPRAHYLERIKTWIERLDREPDTNFERRLYVYPVQNSSAGHLADLLSTIYGGSGTGAKSGGGGVAPGFEPERVTSSGEKVEAGSRSVATSGGTRKVAVGDVRIVADEENNALLIYATGSEYRKIKPALDKLDVTATQVLIEASIVEVTLTDELRYGLEWTFNSGLESDYRGTGQLVDGSGIGLQAPGFAYSVVNSAMDVQVVLNTLASDNLVNVISSPSVMVLDNQTATIEVGDQVPVRTGTTIVEGSGTQIDNISFKDTGVKLSVTPSVNAGGMVTMDIEQVVTDVGPEDEVANQRSFLERSINSKVAVRSSETVVLGGLIRENKSSGTSGIPLLKDIPVFGSLFGSTSEEGFRTELLVVITPRVIFDDSDLRDVSREMRRQMRRLELIDLSESSSYLINNADQVGEPEEQTTTSEQ